MDHDLTKLEAEVRAARKHPYEVCGYSEASLPYFRKAIAKILGIDGDRLTFRRRAPHLPYSFDVSLDGSPCLTSMDDRAAILRELWKYRAELAECGGHAPDDPWWEALAPGAEASR